MITKTIKLEKKIIEDLELAVKGLNENLGVDLYDFSNIVRTAINQFLSSEKIKETVDTARKKEFAKKKELLLASESSLSKDWLSQEEDEAWANL
ncbi:MAG: hypothetical protein KGZ45_04945 [Clostridium sp.]|nr:hypothetical protein [Clostridium sp.]